MTEAAGSQPAPRPWVLERVHVTQGRARLRFRSPMDRDRIGALIDYLAGIPGMRNVVARPNTRSVILTFDGPGEAMMERLAEDDALRVAGPGKPPPVRQVAQVGLLRLDMALKERTDEALDFRTALALLLIFGATLQLMRGRVAGPATTLLVSALSLLNEGARK